MASKNYSGKRVAGRKPVGKRALSLLMALVMSLSLVQITAFSVDEPQPSQDQVMSGWFDASGNKVETGTTESEGFTLSKTIRQTGVNAFDITLTVEATQKVESSDAAVQLIIDTSGSMAFCSVCGADMSKENHKKDCTNKEARQTRLDATKAAINDDETGFLANLLSGNTTGGAIWVSVIRFSGSEEMSSAETVCGWVNIRTEQGLKAVKDAVNRLKAKGATNLEAGLMLARNNLSLAAPAKDIAPSNKYTVLLTDGEPTARCDNDHNSVEAINDYNPGTAGWNESPGAVCSQEELDDAASMAGKVREVSNLYTICYGVADDVLSAETKDVCVNCTKSQREHEKDWVWDLFPLLGHYAYYCNDSHETVYEAKEDVVTVGSFLRDSIASKPEFAFNASSNVNEAFKNIASSTTTGMNGAGTFVTDPMGTFINLSDAEKARLNTISGVSVDGSTIKWNLNPEAATTTGGEDGTGATTFKYTLTYSITLDTAARGFESNTNYPTNGRTFLTIPAEEEGAAASEVDFNIPGVFGQAPDPEPPVETEYTLTVHYYIQGTTDKLQDDLVRTISENTGYAVDVPLSIGEYSYRENTGDLLIGLMNGDKEVNLYYAKDEVKPTEYTLTVHYYIQGTTDKLQDDLVRTISENTGYAVDVPLSIGEYSYRENTGDLLIGLMNGDKEVNLYYAKDEVKPEYVTVTVKYFEKGTSNELREAQSKQFKMENGAADYDVTNLKVDSLDKDGKTYNYDSASENLTGYTQGDLSITLYYKVKSSEPIDPPVNPTYSYYTVTVNYFDKDSGAALRTAYSITQREYTSYDVTAQDAIAIEGYTYAETTGDALKGTLNGSKTINVYYTKDSTPVNPPVTPVDPPVDPNPVAPPETGDAMGFWIAAAAVSGLGLVWLALSSRKRREEA